MPTAVYTLRSIGSFDGTTTGVSPYDAGGLLIDRAGNLIGATAQGGPNGSGTIYEITPAGTGLTVVAPFTAATGYNIYSPSSLVADAAGDLYGEQYFGGVNGYGTVFELANSGTQAAPAYSAAPVALASFDGGATGRYGTSGLFADAAGNLLGMTQVGGAYDEGTVFELVNTGTVAAPSYAGGITVVTSFDGANGREPDFNGRLTADAAGNLIGTVYAGGPDNDGTVFELANLGTAAAPVYAGTPTVLASFVGTGGTGGPDGSRPHGSVVADSQGNLFGTTSEGGANRSGTIYEIVNTGTQSAPAYAAGATTLVSFGMFGAIDPYGSLLIDRAGNLYGTGNGPEGTVFELANLGTVAAPRYAAEPTVLADFNQAGYAAGANPFCDLAVDSAGDLFGTTTTNGASNQGTVFELMAAPAPTITGTMASNSTTAEKPIAPFTAAAVNDPTPGAIDTLTIILTGGGGTLRDGPSFAGTSTLASTGPGTYTLTGSAADVTTELRALSFTPTAGAPGTPTTTNFALSDATSANGFVVATDDTTTVTDTAGLTPPAGEAVTIAPAVSYRNGVFTLTGHASSTVGVSSVDIQAIVDGVPTDLGTTTVDANGNFTFADRVGAHTQGFITATAIDSVENSPARGTAAFSLTGGLRQGAFRAEQDSYTADASAETSTTLFRAGGTRSVDVLAAGQTFSSDHGDVWNDGGTPETAFVFDPGYGRDAVKLFRVDGTDHDTLSFKGSDFGADPASQLAGVLANTHFEKGGAVITDPATQDTVKLFGVSKQQLVANQQDLTFHA